MKTIVEKICTFCQAFKKWVAIFNKLANIIEQGTFTTNHSMRFFTHLVRMSELL